MRHPEGRSPEGSSECPQKSVILNGIALKDPQRKVEVMDPIAPGHSRVTTVHYG